MTFCSTWCSSLLHHLGAATQGVLAKRITRTLRETHREVEGCLPNNTVAFCPVGLKFLGAVADKALVTQPSEVASLGLPNSVRAVLWAANFTRSSCPLLLVLGSICTRFRGRETIARCYILLAKRSAVWIQMYLSQHRHLSLGFFSPCCLTLKALRMMLNDSEMLPTLHASG